MQYFLSFDLPNSSNNYVESESINITRLTIFSKLCVWVELRKEALMTTTDSISNGVARPKKL